MITVPVEPAYATPVARTRPSDRLVPGADPYIARLIQKLQEEVRQERLQESAVAGASPHPAQPQAQHEGPGSLVLEAELPWFDEEQEYDPYDFDGDRFLDSGDDGDLPLCR